MSKQAVKKAPKKKNGYVMPDPIPKGEILQDLSKKKWILGPSIGVGGFGEIYSAAEYSDSVKKIVNYPYVVKIEPHGNGPLFVEMHFYMRNAKPDDITAWRSEKKLTSLGMPHYIGSGSHECNGTKYRFIVMERFGKDLWHLFLENKRCFPTHTVFKIGLQMLDVLEYIHSRGYVHADLKGANALLGLSKTTQNQVYLVDFGLAAHYSTAEQFKPDPKKAHNGTIEYTSRDAHAGVPTRRGDMEILAYNLIQWLGCTLPWEKNLTDPTVVQNSKVKYMNDVNEFLKSCFIKKPIPEALKNFVVYVSKMDHNSEPDYKKCRSILISGLESSGGSIKGALEFKLSSKSPGKRKSDRLEALSPVTPEKKRKGIQQKKFTPTKVFLKKTGKENGEDDESEDETPSKSAQKRGKKVDNTQKVNETNGYTAEMLRVMKKIEESKGGKSNTKKTATKFTKTSRKPATYVSDSEDIIDETPPDTLRKRVTNRKVIEADITPSKRTGTRNRPAVKYISDSE